MLIFQKKSTKELVQGESEESAPKKKLWKPGKKKEKKEQASTSERTAIFRTKAFWGIVSMLLGLAVAFVGVPMLRTEVAETEPTLCFAQDVQRGTLISADMVTLRDMSAYHMPANALHSVQAAVGNYVETDALAGDVVTGQRISSVYPGADPQLANLPDGMVAVSIALPNLSTSVSGKLRQGDVVQLFAIEKSDVYTALAPPELQYLEVLAVTTQDGADVQTKDDPSLDSGESSTLSTVTLLANTAQAAVLAGLDQNASLHAALVVRGNEAAKEAALQKQRDYFAALEADAESDPEAENAAAPEETTSAENAGGTGGKDVETAAEN